MTKCTACGSDYAYVSVLSVECCNSKCAFFTRRQLEAAEVAARAAAVAKAAEAAKKDKPRLSVSYVETTPCARKDWTDGTHWISDLDYKKLMSAYDAKKAYASRYNHVTQKIEYQTQLEALRDGELDRGAAIVGLTRRPGEGDTELINRIRNQEGF